MCKDLLNYKKGKTEEDRKEAKENVEKWYGEEEEEERRGRETKKKKQRQKKRN